MLKVKGSKLCKAQRAKHPLQALVVMEKLESWAIIFQASEGLSYANTSAEQKCFSFNQILKQYQHHPSILALGTVQKTENSRMLICGTTQRLL